MPSSAPPRYVAVIGSGEANLEVAALAYEVGRELARRGAIVICGGLGGVMEAAARGAQEAGGVSIGILPDPDRRRANPYLTYTIPTNLGHARNMVIVHAADAVIAVDGEYGTLSEIAYGKIHGKRVVGIGTWDVKGVEPAETPERAVRLALEGLRG